MSQPDDTPMFHLKQFHVKPNTAYIPPVYPRGCGPDWGEEEKAELKRLRLDGVPVPRIAEMLGRSPRAVSKMLHKLGVVLHPHRPAHLRRVSHE